MVTKTELITQLQDRIKSVDQVASWLRTGPPSLSTLEETIQSSYKGLNVASAEGAKVSVRSAANSLIDSHSAYFRELLIELAQVGYNSTATDLDTAITDIVKGMALGSESVLHRNYALGTIVPGGSNVGTGEVYRLTVDEYGKTIESGYDNAGETTIEISADKNTGATPGNESIIIKGSGGEIPVDAVNRGTMTDTVLETNVLDEGNIGLQNASFSTNNGLPAPNSTFVPWIITTPANADIETTEYFRNDSGSGSTATGTAIKFTGNNKIEQTSLTNFDFDSALPVMLLARFRRNGVDGALTLRLGSQTVVISDLTTVADLTWLTLALGIDQEMKGWYNNFKEDDNALGLRISVELTGNSVGELLLDHLVLANPEQFDNGFWYQVVSGRSDFLKNDKFIVTDTLTTQGKIQFWLAYFFNRYLLHSATPTIPDPA